MISLVITIISLLTQLTLQVDPDFPCAALGRACLTFKGLRVVPYLEGHWGLSKKVNDGESWGSSMAYSGYEPSY